MQAPLRGLVGKGTEVTEPRRLLQRLLEYIEEQAKEIDPTGYCLSQTKGFIRRREQYALRPGVWAPWLSLASIAAGKRADAVAYFFKTTPAEAVLERYQRGLV